MGKKIENRIYHPFWFYIRRFFYIKKFECPQQYIVDMIRDLTESIMTSYPEVEDKISIYSF